MGYPDRQAQACGGDALMRADAFAAADGFRADLIAGRRARTLCAPSCCWLQNLAAGRRNDPARRGHDALWPMVAAHPARWSRLC